MPSKKSKRTSNVPSGTSNTDEPLPGLLRKRSSIMYQFNSLKSFVNILTAKLKSEPPEDVLDTEIVQLQERLNKIDDLLWEYQQIQTEIECIVDQDEVEVQFQERQAFESDYFEGLSQAKQIMTLVCPETKRNGSGSGNRSGSSRNQSPRSSHRHHASRSLCHPHFKLPPLKIPKFNGTYDQWLVFFDTFHSLIHSNASLSNIHKFRYLRDSLEGEAAQVIQSFETTSDNYEAAWSLIQNRYENKKLRIHNHIKGVVDFPLIAKESFSALRDLLDTTQSHIRALKSLGEPVDQWSSLLIYLLSNKFDLNTRSEWEKATLTQPSMPTIQNLMDFLETRCHLLEKILDEHPKVLSTPKIQTNLKSKFQKSLVNNLSHTISCPICKSTSHQLFSCSKFLQMSAEARIDEVKKHKYCLNCLRPGHLSPQCNSSYCRKCNKRHNTLLHIERKKEQDPVKASEGTATMSNASSQFSSTETHQLLATAMVSVLDINNQPKKCIALLDSGSQANFIREDLCHHLKLPTSQVRCPIIGIGGARSNSLKEVSATVKSNHSEYSTTLTFLILPEITKNLPTTTLDPSTIQIPNNVVLADPEFYKPKQIDMLLGVDIFWEILGRNSTGNPYIHNTLLGGVVSGKIPVIINPIKRKSSPSQSHVKIQSSSHLTCLDLSNQIAKFWEVESISNTKSLSQEEKACESHFTETHKRTEDGRFMVTIPLLSSPSSLGDSFELAKRRFLSVEKKLQSNKTLCSKYSQFMQEYEDLGHMSISREIDPNEINYFLPHHGVINDSSLTTKLRVVFDASAPTTSGISFNDLQMVGPTIQSDLLSILIRFRTYKYVVSSDISKMYRQILVNHDQRSLQQIIWRANPSSPLQVYKLNTVTYGTASAPFLAIRCIFQLAHEYADMDPRISQIMQNSMYVDDLLCGADTVEETSYICQTISSILKSAGFELRKWLSNEPSILVNLHDQNIACNMIELGAGETHKTLGLSWCSNSDTLIYQINAPLTNPISKRSVLSIIARTFDPLGLLSPCIMIFKSILQMCWMANVGWDDPLPNDIQSKFVQFYDELPMLNNLTIPRHACLTTSDPTEIHGFSDSSKQAYGGCVYLRSIDSDGQTHVNLLCAKTKVAPVKTITIPRLELLGAQVLVRLVNKVKQSLEIPIKRYVYWTDSTIILGWIHTEPNTLDTFVANRVAEIQTLTEPSQWRHVDTNSNPADLVTRGVRPSKLHSESLWWHGPEFLQCSEPEWPTLPVTNISNKDKAIKVQSSIAVQSQKSFFFARYSNLTTLERIVAWCLRFKHNTSKPEHQLTGPLSAEEIKNSNTCLIKVSQHEIFYKEINNLSNEDPFLHMDGTLRVGGRISLSNFEFDKKHPLIIPSNHDLSILMFTREHIRMLHCGPQQLLFSIRQRFWPIDGRRMARKIVHKCVICFKAKPKPTIPIMGDLPPGRISISYPFSEIGIDYAGPFLLKDGKTRKPKLIKGYVALFICYAVKAIHLELVTELTTNGFLACFRRFISRRGIPKIVNSDNASNFAGARSELSELYEFFQNKSTQETIQNSFSNENITWRFIPPRAPHFGGLWEAGVKSMKFHLRRILGNALLTFEDFNTILIQIESVLNSRPISPLSNDPTDLDPLTPGHFLVGRPLLALPENDFTEEKESRLDKFQRLQQLYQHFWARWSKEYISELQTRTKWTTMKGHLLEEGALVIVKEDNVPPRQWRIGRILKLHPGADNVVRVVTLKFASGQAKRPVHKICVLPIGEQLIP